MWRELFDGCLHVDPTQQTAEALTLPPNAIPTCKGVVLFCDSDDRPVQLLIGANIRRLVKNRLFPPEPEHIGKRADISAIVRRVHYLCCYNDFRSTLRHLQIAQAVYPDTWRKFVTLPRGCFVRINPRDQWPNFSPTNKPSLPSDEKCFGPFPTRKSADKFITALRSAFGLCFRPDLVDSAKKAATCPYLQMNTCPAPCVEHMSRETYFEQIDHAISAATGQAHQHIEAIRQEMTQLAEQMQFEQAAIAKKRIEMLELLLRNDYRWTTDLSNLAILHIDRSGKVAPAEKKRKIQTYAAFLITGNGLTELEDFTIENTQIMHASLMDRLNEPVPTTANEQTPEQLALAAYFLYRRNPAGIWINCPADNPPNTENLITAINEKWPAKVPPKDQHVKATGD